jgi:hypothetical protein
VLFKGYLQLNKLRHGAVCAKPLVSLTYLRRRLTVLTETDSELDLSTAQAP